MQTQEHWEKIYASKPVDQVSWFRPHLETSFALIERAANGNRDAAIVDVGGGASALAGALLDEGYLDVSVLDVSRVALGELRKRLGAGAERVRIIEADVLDYGFDRDCALRLAG